MDLTVDQALNPDGSWNLDFLDALLPSHLVEKIRSIPRPISVSLKDTLYWSGTPDGRFTVKSAFEIQQLNQEPCPGEWKWIWRIPCIERIRSFLWLLTHNKLLTNLSRFFRHLTTNADCPHCTGIEESLSHVLRDCPIARETWARIGMRSQGFFHQPFTTWIRSNSKITPPSQESTPWFLIFLGTIWKLWNARNLWIFEGKGTSPFQIARQALALARETAGTLTLGEIVTNRRGLIMVQWKPPPANFFKLNTDGSFNNATKNASAGGVIRDSQGNWIRGFYTNIGESSSFEAELWGLREGLRLCLNLNIQQVQVEIDSAAIVTLLQAEKRPNEALNTLMIDCNRLLQQFSSASVNHIFREGNSVADRLAELGHSAPRGTTELEAPPSLITLFLDFKFLLFYYF